MFHVIASILGAIGVGIGIGIWCALVTLLLPEPVRIARNSALIAPFTAALVGFLGLAAVFGLTTLMSLSLILIVTAVCVPLVALFDLFIGLLVAIGLAVVAEPVGHVILRRRGIYAAPIAAATVGGCALTIIILFLTSLPFGLSVIGYIALIAIFSVGLGSLALTRFGRRAYPKQTYV